VAYSRTHSAGDGHRRVAVLMGLVETDPFTIKYAQALRGALEKLGWTEGQNIQFIYRYAAGDPALARTYAKPAVAACHGRRGD
jgi:hypothetical protein